MWLQLIPGMFVYDAYRRSRETRLFAQSFLAPRKAAMDAAQRMVRGETRDAVLGDLRERIRDWLIQERLDSDAVREKQMAVAILLADHYFRLLAAEGESFPDLVIDAYHDRAGYDEFLNQLTLLENELDDVVADMGGRAEEVRKHLLLEREVKRKLRNKDADAIF